MVAFGVMRYREVKGHWPLLKSKENAVETASNGSNGSNPNVVQDQPVKSEA